MPDGSTTVVGAKQGQTINYVLGKMLDKRGLSIASVDVFLLGSDKVCSFYCYSLAQEHNFHEISSVKS